MLEAVWDPVAGKVVYLETTTTPSTSTDDGVVDGVDVHSNKSSSSVTTETEEKPSSTTATIAFSNNDDDDEYDHNHRDDNNRQCNGDDGGGKPLVVAEVEGSVVEKENLPSSAKKKQRRQQQQRRSSGKGITMLEWRHEQQQQQEQPMSSSTTTTARDGSSGSTGTNNRQQRLYPVIAPSKFHTTTAMSSQQHLLQRLRQEIQFRVITQQTRKQRKEYRIQRQRYYDCTTCQTYPIQEPAIQQFQQLRIAYGIPEIAIPSEATNTTTTTTSNTLQDNNNIHHVVVSPTPLEQEEEADSFGCPFTSTTSSSALWSMEPRLFGSERKINGKRQYIVAHAGRYIEHYWQQPPPRHAYELIRPHTPCRLYLDIEATIQDHPILVQQQQNNAVLQEQFLTELYKQLAMELQIQYGNGEDEDQSASHGGGAVDKPLLLLPLERRHIVDLDSSTDTKFSRHWIVHIPIPTTTTMQQHQPLDDEILFPDVAAVGIFVRQWISRLAQEQATGQLQQSSPTLHQHLFFTADNNHSSEHVQCVVDLGVYTRNRLFRLLGSCKFGKPQSAALRIATTNEFPFPHGFGNHLFYAPAMDSQQQTVDPLRQHLHNNDDDDDDDMYFQHQPDHDVDMEIQKSLSKTDWTMHATALAATLVVPLDCIKYQYPILPRLSDNGGSSAAANNSKSGSVANGPAARTALRMGQSPYPMIDDYVYHHLATRGGDNIQGVIRGWSIESDPTSGRTLMITYQMTRNRYCECIGRHHKSNNIVWHVDVQRGQCYQTCHDPQCRALNFRGQYISLPSAVQNELQEALWDEELGRLDVSNLVPNDNNDNFASSSSSKEMERFDIECSQCTADCYQRQENHLQDGTAVNDGDIIIDDDSSFDEALATLSLDEISLMVPENVDTSKSMQQRHVTTPNVESRNSLCTSSSIADQSSSAVESHVSSKVDYQPVETIRRALTSRDVLCDKWQGSNGDEDEESSCSEEDLLTLAQRTVECRQQQHHQEPAENAWLSSRSSNHSLKHTEISTETVPSPGKVIEFARDPSIRKEATTQSDESDEESSTSEDLLALAQIIAETRHH